MKKLLVILAVLALATSAQAAFFFEDWETGTDGWVNYSVTPAAISQEANTTPGGSWSLKTADTGTNYTNALDYNFAAATQTAWEATWWFYDRGSTREYVQLRNYVNPATDTTLNQIISFGTYNGAPAQAGVYNFRVGFGGIGWSNTTIARVANVWHEMKVTQDAAGNINFYIDGNLGATTTTTSIFGINDIRVGGGLSNVKGAYYDDILITTVPEPGSLLALASGLIGLVGVGIRRRK